MIQLKDNIWKANPDLTCSGQEWDHRNPWPLHHTAFFLTDSYESLNRCSTDTTTTSAATSHPPHNRLSVPIRFHVCDPLQHHTLDMIMWRRHAKQLVSVHSHLSQGCLLWNEKKKMKRLGYQRRDCFFCCFKWIKHGGRGKDIDRKLQL